MRFARPDIFLYALVIIPILAGCLFFWAGTRKKMLSRLMHVHLLGEMIRGYSDRRSYLKDGLLLGAVFLIFIALARPQWGFEWQKVQRQGLDIFVAIDTSRSMLTEDVRPNRLERAKFSVKDLVRKLKGDRIGLIAFSGKAFLVCPLTTDYAGAVMSLDSLSVETIPRGGTNLGSAIQEALKGYEDVPSRYKVVIIITDGENWEGDPAALAKEASSRGVKLYTVGIGTKEGELIRLSNEQGQSEFLKDKDGNVVKSRLNESLLKDIAVSTGGVYVRASGAQSGLDYVYDQQLSALERRDIDSDVERKYHERFQWFLSVALIMIVAEMLLSTKRTLL